MFCGKLTSVSSSWNFILASDTHATKPVQKVHVLNSCAVLVSKLNFSKTTSVAAINKWSYFVDSGRNSTEIKFVLEGGLLAYSCRSTITHLGLMLLELVDVILSLISICVDWIILGWKDWKMKAWDFEIPYRTAVRKVKIDGNYANGIIVDRSFSSKDTFSQYHTILDLHKIYTNINDKTLRTSPAPNACYCADMVPEAAVVALLQKVYYPFPAGNSVNTPGVRDKVSEKSAVSL